MRPFRRGSLRIVHQASRLVPLVPLLLTVALACGGVPAAGSDPALPDPDLPADFSRELAWSELETLAGLGPRPLGSDAAEAARQHIRERMAAAGVAVETVSTTSEAEGYGPLALTHLVASLPGRSSDRIVLTAPYGSGQYDAFAFTGVNEGASGAALLLEVGRVLAGRELPYTVELVWIEGEGRLGRGEGSERDLRHLGSRSLAKRWGEEGRLDGIRLLVSFDRVCDADLRIARDLGSHRSHREEFWGAARRLGRTAAFPPASRYESVVSSHAAFRAAGLRRVLALEDTAYGGDEAPGLFAGEGDAIEHCAPESLETVGVVALEALETIALRLEKIDRFARTPTAEPAPAVAPEPEPQESAPAPSEAEAETPAAEGVAPGDPEPPESPDAADAS